MGEAAVPDAYEQVRLLGIGGFGEVSLVRERSTGRELAIKRLARIDPTSVVRFKNEFRLLQGLRHPALAQLHELVAERDGWYLVMEYVRGETFTSWVRPSTATSLATTLPEDSVTLDKPQPAHYDEVRLRGALRGIAHGLVALHEAGIIHRDLKPQNVLVASDGRVVILDFGLAANLVDDIHLSLDPKVMGTPGYIAPEQAKAEAVTRAVDWYAVGVMLFEALTGRRPYVGSIIDVVRAQLEAPTPDPGRYTLDLPKDLRDLCMRLLASDPIARPDGAAVLSALGTAGGAGPRREVFVGRTEELRTLGVALDEVVETRAPQIVHVIGSSGLGKSALVARALADMRARHGAVVLAGRCYEREALPYKAIDPLIDALADYLRRMSQEEIRAVMPRDVPALCRLFPALGQIDELARVHESEKVENLDELRRRAIAALREMLGKIAAGTPIVLAIDDLQWGCLDSARVLAALVAPPAAPRMLAVLSYRPQEPVPAPALALLRGRLDESKIAQRPIVLGPLTEADAERLARALLPEGAGDDAVHRVAVESGCNPLFVAELARGPHPAGMALEQLLAERAAELSPVARKMLELVSVAARAVELEAVCEAAAIARGDADIALVALEEANMVRHAASARGVVVEAIHDRIREVIVAQLAPAQLVAYHLALAESLEHVGAGAETIAEHFRLAGDAGRARPHALRAAEAASAALAHDRAMALYRLALAGSTGVERFAILMKLAEALAFDSRGLDAAASFREALPLAPTPVDAVEVRGRIAHQLLGSGRIDDGLDAVEELLAAAKIEIPRSPRRAVMSLLYQRLRLRMRGLELVRRLGETPRDVLIQIDSCWTVGMALTGVDLVRAANIQSRHLRHALEAGEPYRVARGLALETCLLALDGHRGQHRAASVLQRAEELANEIAHPHAMAWASGAAAVSAWCVGRWREAVSLSSYAIALLRSRCMDVGWELCSLDVWFRIRSLITLGEIATAVADAAVVDRDAERRADLYALTSVRTAVSPTCRLLAGDPGGATRIAHEAIAGWSKRGWHFQHQEVLRADCLVDLYTGEPARALARLDERWPAMTASMMLRIQNQRIQAYGLQGLAAVRAAQQDPEHRTAHLRLARRRSKQLQRERNPWASALGLGLDARLAAYATTDDAPARLEIAERAFADLEMVLHAAALRRMRGVLIGGTEGRGLVAEVDRDLTARGVAAPARLADWLAA